MRTPLALLVILFASAARAGVPTAPTEPASKEVVEPSFYWYSSGIAWWGDAVSRRDIYLPSDLPNIEEICMIPPTADWIAEGGDEAAQKKYLHLLARVTYSIAAVQGKSTNGGGMLDRCGVLSTMPLAGVGEYSNIFSGFLPKEVKDRIRWSSCVSSKYPVKGSPKYASHGKVMSSPGVAVIDTVNQLLKSKNPQILLSALGIVREIHRIDKFRDSLEALANDKSLTGMVTIEPPGWGKETLPVRVYAMRTLATVERTERSAKLLALIWHDETEKPEMREGALRAFSFALNNPAAEGVSRAEMLKTLYPFLNPIMGINADENDKKEEAGANAKLSPLGDAAYCVASSWPQEKRANARKGLDWDGNSAPQKSPKKKGSK